MKKDIYVNMINMRLAATISCLTAVFFAFPALLYAAGGGSLEPPTYWNKDTGNQIAVASVMDNQGNIIMTGTSNKNGTDDFYTIKIKADYSGVLWRSTYDLAGGTDTAVAVAVDGNDNVIVTGVGNRSGVKKEIVTIKYCGKTVTTPGGYDPPIPGTAYPGLCSAGDIIWTATYDDPTEGNAYPTSLAVDADKNIYVGGYGQSLSGDDNDFILLKYATAGPNADGSPTWQRSYGGSRLDNDYITDVATCSIPGSNQYFVAVTGHVFDTNNSYIHTIKYDSAGTRLWQQTLTAKVKVNEVSPKIAMDSSCNVVVSGSVVGSGSNDIYTIKYAADTGQELWNRSYAGNDDDQLNDVYIDKSNDVFLVGQTFVTMQDYNFYTARLNGNTGAVLWEKKYDSGYWDSARSVVVDNAASAVYVSGVTLDNNNDYDFRTIKYSLADGNLLWYSTFDSAAGSQTDWPVGMDLNTAGEILVTGYIDAGGAGTSLDYYAIKYVPALINPPITYTISGNAGVAGATLSYTDGNAKTTTTNDSGAYSFTISYNWSGSVTPSKTGYIFSPANKAYTNVITNQSVQNYTATPITYTISGNAGVAGATLSYTNGTAQTATTNDSGTYSFTVPYNWSGLVTPNKAGYTFRPANKAYPNVFVNQTVQNYTATPITYIISGNAGVAGATLNYADGNAKTATANDSGNYNFTVSYNWSGSVTPSKTGYTFSPMNKTYTNILNNQSIQNYTATVQVDGHLPPCDFKGDNKPGLAEVIYILQILSGKR